MHVAKLGGMPEDIVRHAVTKSQQLEASQQHTLRRNQFAKLAQALKADDTTALQALRKAAAPMSVRCASPPGLSVAGAARANASSPTLVRLAGRWSETSGES